MSQTTSRTVRTFNHPKFFEQCYWFVFDLLNAPFFLVRCLEVCVVGLQKRNCNNFVKSKIQKVENLHIITTSKPNVLSASVIATFFKVYNKFPMNCRNCVLHPTNRNVLKSFKFKMIQMFAISLSSAVQTSHIKQCSTNFTH